MFWSRPCDSGEAESYLILQPNSFLGWRWFLAETIIGLKLHFLETFLHILGYFRLPLCPFMCDVNLGLVFSLPSECVVVLADVAELHGSFLLYVAALVEHISLLVLLFPVSCDGICVDGVLWTQFIRDLLDSPFVFFWLFRLFTEAAHIRHSWLLLGRWILSRRLSIGWCGLSLGRRRRCFLALCWLFRLFFFGLLVFRRHGIKDSRWFYLFLVFGKGGNVDGLALVLIESFDWVFKFVMEGAPVTTVGLDYTFDEVEGYVEPFLGLFLMFFLGALQGITVILAHLIPNLSLIMALLYQPLLLLEPPCQFLQCGYLILSGVDLRDV